MLYLRRILMAACCAGLIAAALAAPAQAQVQAKHWKYITCWITGRVTTSAKFGFPPPKAKIWVSSTLRLRCAVYFKKKVDIGIGGSEVDVVEADMGTTGLASLGLCGSGSAGDDDPTITNAVSLTANPNTESIVENLKLGYNIVFAGGNGTLVWTDGPYNTLTPNPRVTGTQDQPVGGGYVNIVPALPFPSGSPPDGECANAFEVNAFVTGDFVSVE